MVPTFVSLVFIFTLVAAITDLRTRKIPNWLTVPACVAGIAFHLVTGGLSGLGVALGGFAVGFGLLLVLWLIGGGGAGDVKLMGALGAWLGPVPIVIVFLLSTCFAILCTLLLVVGQFLTNGYGFVRRRYLPTQATLGTGTVRTQHEKVKRRILPYAMPVALATWTFLAWKVLEANYLT